MLLLFPLISTLGEVFDHNLLTCQHFHRVLPKIREVVYLSIIDYLRYVLLDLFVLESNDLDIMLLVIDLDIN